MIEGNNVDFGSIQVHQEALADIVISVLSEMEGVSLVSKDLKAKLLGFLGKESHPGIKITIDKDNQANIEIRVRVRYGINIPTIGQQIQEAVRLAIEKTADIGVKNINVNICGMYRV